MRAAALTVAACAVAARVGKPDEEEAAGAGAALWGKRDDVLGVVIRAPRQLPEMNRFSTAADGYSRL